MRSFFYVFVICAGYRVFAEDFAQSRRWMRALHWGSDLFETAATAEEQLALDRKRIEDPVFRCRYPYRTQLLYREFKHHDFDTRNCAELEKWMKTHQARALNLIFASSFPEAPPSMFGHLFFHLVKNPEQQKVELFDHGLNFAAAVPPDAGIEMAPLGLFGGYEGHFTLAPIHVLLAE